MCRYAKMSWNQIWMRPVAVQVTEEFEYYRERFEMILQDLSSDNPAQPLILEGVAFLPELVEQMGANPNRALYLVPTREFQIHHYRQRPWIQHILKECQDPGQAFDNWMQRDHLFGQEVLRQAQARNYKTLVVDGQLGIDALYQRVKTYFALGEK